MSIFASALNAKLICLPLNTIPQRLSTSIQQTVIDRGTIGVHAFTRILYDSSIPTSVSSHVNGMRSLRVAVVSQTLLQVAKSPVF